MSSLMHNRTSTQRMVAIVAIAFLIVITKGPTTLHAQNDLSLIGVNQVAAPGSIFDHVIQVGGSDILGTEFEFAYNQSCFTLNEVSLATALASEFNIDVEGNSVMVYPNLVTPPPTIAGGSDMVTLNFTASSITTACGITETVSIPTVLFTDSDGNELGGTTTDGIITIANDPPTVEDDLVNIGTELSAQTLDVLANDSDPEGLPLLIVSIGITETDGSVTNNTTDITYTATGNTPVDTFTYVTSDGTSDSTESATVTVVYGEHGDCNFSGSTNIADIIRFLVEYFSQDTSTEDYLTVFSGALNSSPNGCDANGDATLGAADIPCMVDLAQGRPCGGTVMAASTKLTTALPTLSLNSPVVNENERFYITLDYQDNGNSVTAMLFALDYNSSYLSADGNVTFNLNDQYNGGAGTEAGRYTMSVFSMDKLVVPSGTLATIPMIAACGNQAAIDMGFSEDPAPSLSSISGVEITPELATSGVFVQCDDGDLIYVPLMVRQ
ncbi:MAG: hypothetical protein AAF702_16975 [Chloroflexota bacterium]